MPIPKKPSELREMILLAFCDRGSDASASDLADIAMRAIAEYDPCFEKAAEAGEPAFTLRAQDQTADALVDLWAQKAHSEAAKASRNIRIHKLASAQLVADAMRAWPNRKLPD